MSKQVVLGKVTGEKGDSGFSPIVELKKEDGVLNISVTDERGTKTESIVTGENVQGDWDETDTSKESYIWNKPTIPSKVSELENDMNFQMVNTTYKLNKSGNNIILTGSDGSTTSVLDADTDTTYGNADVNTDGLMPKELVQKLNTIEEGAEANVITGIKGNAETTYRTGQVNITPENIGAEKTGVANSLISTHNTSTVSHSDIRNLIIELTNRFNALADSDDTTLDQMSELVTYIKSNKSVIDSITTNKINVSDIVDNLTTNISNKVLSASQGVALKSLIDELELVVGNKADASVLSSHTSNTNVHTNSTERTNWNAAKTHADSAHAPSNAEKNILVGIQKNGTDLTVDSNRKVNVTVPTKISELTNDKGYITSHQDISGKLDKTGDASNVTNTFSSETSRTNLTTGEKLSISLGKIVKWFTDLKAVAFSGKYSDLSGTPTKLSDFTNDVGFKTTDTVYEHPNHNEHSSGLYKITVDDKGHVSAVTAVSKSDITDLGIPSSDTNTHYTSKNVVNNSASATGNTSTALTNGNVYLVSVENGVATSAHKISGSGATTVTTDASGNIVISSTDTNTVYTHPTTSGNKHIPSGGSSGQILRWSADGTAVWGADNNTTYSNFVKSGSGAKAGLVPAPSTTAGTTKYLREDGTWQVPPNTNTTYSVVTSSANGLVPMFDASDGTIDSSSTDWVLTNNNGSIGWYKLPANAFNNTTYSAATTSANGLMSASDKSKLDNTNVAYGTCSTAAATAAKVITVSGNTNWKLVAGSRITVKFSATNTASNPTFNVNGTGEKSVWYNTAVITTSNLSYAGYANRPMDFVYDGTQYVFVGWSIDSNTTYSQASLGQGYGTCSTAAATAAKVVTLSSYSLATNGIVAVKFTYAVPANATMNINDKGAKAIYYRGSAITDGVINAGDLAFFMYNGSQYHLLGIDSKISSSGSGEVYSSTEPSGQAVGEHWVKEYT